MGFTGVSGKIVDNRTKLLFSSESEDLKKEISKRETENTVIKWISNAVKVCSQRGLDRLLRNAVLAGNLKGQAMYGSVNGDHKEALQMYEDNARTKDKFAKAKLAGKLTR